MKKKRKRENRKTMLKRTTRNDTKKIQMTTGQKSIKKRKRHDAKSIFQIRTKCYKYPRWDDTE